MTRPFFTPHLARPAELLAPQHYRPGVSADPQSWTPPTVASVLGSALKAHWVSTEGVTDAGSGKVSSWVDRTSSAWDAAQGTDANRPVVVADADGLGRPGITFDGSAPQFLKVPASVLGGSVDGAHVYVVSEADDVTNPHAWIDIAKDGAGTARLLLFSRGNAEGDPVAASLTSDTAGSWTPVTNPGYSANTIHVASLRWLGFGGDITAEIDGGSGGTKEVSAGHTLTVDETLIGIQEDEASAPAYGTVFEIIVADGTPTAGQHAQILSILATEYGTPRAIA